MPIKHSDLKQVQSNIEKQISRQTHSIIKTLENLTKNIEELNKLIKDGQNEQK